jgi:hypothetical protein
MKGGGEILFSRPYIFFFFHVQHIKKKSYIFYNPPSVTRHTLFTRPQKLKIILIFLNKLKIILMISSISDAIPFLGCIKYHMLPCEQDCFFVHTNKMCKNIDRREVGFGYMDHLINIREM